MEFREGWWYSLSGRALPGECLEYGQNTAAGSWRMTGIRAVAPPWGFFVKLGTPPGSDTVFAESVWGTAGRQAAQMEGNRPAAGGPIETRGFNSCCAADERTRGYP